MTVFGATSNLGRRKVPKSLSEVKNAQRPGIGSMPQVCPLSLFFLELASNFLNSIHRDSP